MKYDFAYSSTSRWVDSTGKNQGMGDRKEIFAFARDNGWDLVAVSDGIMYFKRPVSWTADEPAGA
ncbi:MAG: hypothetical protein ACAH95_12575 [Fimbriimonas sp.]